MAVALYQNLEKETHGFARNIEDHVLTKKQRLTNEELFEVIDETAFISTIEGHMTEYVEQQIDEVRGQVKDLEEEVQKEAIISERRAELSEQALFSSKVIGQSHRISLTMANNLADRFDVPVVYDFDIEDICEESLMENDADDNYWDDMLPTISEEDLLASEKMKKFQESTGLGVEEILSLLEGSYKELFPILQKCTSITELRNLLNEINAGSLLRYGYFMSALIGILDLILDKGMPVRGTKRKRE